MDINFYRRLLMQKCIKELEKNDKVDNYRMISSINTHIKKVKKICKYSFYNLTYKNVLCTAVKWNGQNSRYVFWYYGKRYVFVQKGVIFAKTKECKIKASIEMFLDYEIKKCHKCFYCGCGECKKCKY